MIDVSIITICRNSAFTIAKTLESVLTQKEAVFEYIVIDGDSTDGTQNIARSYDGIDLFISESDDGIADAFNKGITKASGDIVGLINADDQLLPGVLDRVRNFFADNPDVDVLHGDVLLCAGDCVIKRLRPAGRWWLPWRLVLFNHPATFVRREVYEKFGLFDLNYRVAMDVEIFLRWSTKGVRIMYLPEMYVSMQTGGLSGQCAEEGFRESRCALLHHGFSPFLVHVQFVCKLLVNRILSICS
ncbi:MAG: glycosyltransferase family 2 protein [Desulfuromonadales bacterium]